MIILILCRSYYLSQHFSIKYYVNEMIRLQKQQVDLTTELYNSKLELTPELSNVASFIMQNIPPTTKILAGLNK